MIFSKNQEALTNWPSKKRSTVAECGVPNGKLGGGDILAMSEEAYHAPFFTNDHFYLEQGESFAFSKSTNTLDTADYLMQGNPRRVGCTVP